MRLIKLVIAALLVTGLCFAGTKSGVTKSVKKAAKIGPVLKKSIGFKKGNFFAFNQVISATTLQDFTSKVLTHSKKKLYMYFDSPGGSLFAGTSIIRMMRTRRDIKYICVARFAFSAAFMIFENCDERYLLTDGMLMSHNAAGTFSGEFPRVQTLFVAVKAITIRLERDIAKKLKMSFKEYKRRINNNMWLDIKLAKKHHAIDGVIDNVKCSKRLTRSRVKKTVTLYSLFGSRQKSFTFSGCPLLTDPLNDQEDEESLNLYYNNKRKRMTPYDEAIRSIR